MSTRHETGYHGVIGSMAVSLGYDVVAARVNVTTETVAQGGASDRRVGRVRRLEGP
jgi:hypothetical protein